MGFEIVEDQTQITLSTSEQALTIYAPPTGFDGRVKPENIDVLGLFIHLTSNASVNPGATPRTFRIRLTSKTGTRVFEELTFSQEWNQSGVTGTVRRRPSRFATREAQPVRNFILSDQGGVRLNAVDGSYLNPDNATQAITTLSPIKSGDTGAATPYLLFAPLPQIYVVDGDALEARLITVAGWTVVATLARRFRALLEAS